MSLSGRGRLLTHFSLCLPTWLRICNLHRCCSGRGATVEEDGDGGWWWWLTCSCACDWKWRLLT